MSAKSLTWREDGRLSPTPSLLLATEATELTRVRELLIEARARGEDFGTAWPAALATVNAQWAEALAATAGEWASAYRGEPGGAGAKMASALEMADAGREDVEALTREAPPYFAPAARPRPAKAA